MLTALVSHLEAFEEMEPALEALGQRHAGYGVRPEHYAMVTSSLIWALGRALEEEFLPDLEAAWVAVIEATAAVMKRGAAALPPV